VAGIDFYLYDPDDRNLILSLEPVVMIKSLSELIPFLTTT
jgi:hypothetical protein